MRILAAILALVATSTGAHRAADRDFEFDDDALQEVREDDDVPSSGAGRHRFIYDPQSPLCGAAACGAGERCVLRDGRRPVCASGHSVNGNDNLLPEGHALQDADAPPEWVSVTGAVCGRDNRTYPSLCALDARHCARRDARDPRDPREPRDPRGRVAAVRPRCYRPCPCPRPHHHHHHEQIHNDVISDIEPRRRQPDDGAGCAMGPLADRLLDWFSVLMRDAPPPPRRGFPSDCKPEVRWMFEHLDTDGDGLLSDDNLYALKHDERERCLRPLLRGCGRRGPGAGPAGSADAAGAVTRRQWCGCLRAAARPCAAMARRRRGWRPACDARGYFAARQCDAALGQCWCVDAHGAELPATRTRGRLRCPGERPPPAPESLDDDEDAADDDDDDNDNDNDGGSGDAPPAL